MSNQLNHQVTDALFAELCKLSSEIINEAIEKATNNAVEELYRMLEKCEDWIRPDFSLAVNLFESNAKWLAVQVSTNTLTSLKESHVNEQTPSSVVNVKPLKEASLDNLSLVSKGEFEDWLVANMGVKFLEAELSNELLSVTQILHCLSGKRQDAKSCSISPESIFEFLKEAVDSLEIPQAPQTPFYKTLSRSLLPDLKRLYVGVAREAQKAGLNYKSVSLDLSSQITEVKSPTNLETAQQKETSNINYTQSVLPVNQNKFESDSFGYDYSEGLGSRERHQQSNSADQLLKLNTLSRLNATVSNGGKLAESTVGQLFAQQNPLQLNSLVSTISKFQQTFGDESVAKEQGTLRTWVESSLIEAEIDKASIDSQGSELIDVTDRFFEAVVEKIGVSGLLKKWLGKLKITILKVVLHDNSFFSDVNHPARQLLNKLAKLAANDRSGNKRLEKVLDVYIDRVITDFDEDENVIESVVEELDGLLERQAMAYKRNSERLARTYEGKQKVADARHMLVKDLDALLSKKSVPAVLLELLDKGGWREHLTLTIIRYGHKAEAYKEVLNVVEQLLEWLGESAHSSEKWALELEMELEAPSLLDMVTRELEIVGPLGYESILQSLEDCLFNDVDPLLIKIDKYEWPFEKEEKDLDDLQPSASEQNLSGYWHKRIVSMKIGDWIELKKEHGKVHCLRLAWSGSESFRFVFVDSQGMKDEDVSLNELVALFKENKASFVDHDEVPLVDQGLHQMVQSVYEELSSQSNCDLLTGLLNRQAFERALEQSIAGAVTNKSKAALLYIDLDKFNITNTSYGHHAGDALLQHVASIVRDQAPDNAFCGRLGGNEFGMILTGFPDEKGIEIANNICKSVQNEHYQWEENSITSTVSIGFVSFNVESDSYNSIMRKAGLACESAKGLGRNRVVEYTEQDKDQLKRDEMLQWVQRLDQNLDELLTLRCQEIRPINPKGDALSHYEILLGVRYEGQVLPPGMLIEAAEHFGRMAKVDRWVVHNVLEWMETHASVVAKSDGFSINLSGNSMSDDTFLEFLLGEFAASTVSPELICFEITETAAITNLADATEFIRVLKKTGCKFSLDDFGSGLSSYAYIQKLPVDFIKIDGIFIRNLATNEQDRALVKSINELAHFMGMKTVAEFVENYDILEVLKEIGVDHSQGYGIKKPGLLADLS
ncbi:MAG: diguanylate cyclase (GGDEF)-like protein [Oleiphilaceae bacterium]|jgi:diguanylate cyclase (GGDEF)-like protein